MRQGTFPLSGRWRNANVVNSFPLCVELSPPVLPPVNHFTPAAFGAAAELIKLVMLKFPLL